MACVVDVWVEKRGVDRQVVVVVGVHGGFVGGDASIAIMTGDPHRHGSGTATSSRGKRRRLQRQQRRSQLQRRSKLMERPLARGKPC